MAKKVSAKKTKTKRSPKKTAKPVAKRTAKKATKKAAKKPKLPTVPEAEGAATESEGAAPQARRLDRGRQVGCGGESRLLCLI